MRHRSRESSVACLGAASIHEQLGESLVFLYENDGSGGGDDNAVRHERGAARDAAHIAERGA